MFNKDVKVPLQEAELVGTSSSNNIIGLMIPNLVESSLMGKIQDQFVSTYILDNLSVLTLATGI